MKTISHYEEKDGKIRVYTPYSENVVTTCRSWAGKFTEGAWVLPASRLAEVQDRLGSTWDDLVEVTVTSKDWTGSQQIRIGWYILAGRRGRDNRADVYADLIAGSIPGSGGSVKHPAVNPSDDAVFQLWVPRDFAEARKLQIVTDPKKGVEQVTPCRSSRTVVLTVTLELLDGEEYDPEGWCEYTGLGVIRRRCAQTIAENHDEGEVRDPGRACT